MVIIKSFTRRMKINTCLLYTSKKIIVTGCNGQLGRAVNQQYAGSTEYELVNTDVAELDITRVDKVLELAR